MDIYRFNKVLETLKRDALKAVKQSAPVRTYNLQNSIKVRDLPNGGFEIFIDTNQAPYAEATIGPWVHGRWHGRQNPNEGWYDESIEQFIKTAKVRLSGQIIRRGVDKDE